MNYYKFVDIDDYNKLKQSLVKYIANTMSNSDQVYNELENSLFKQHCSTQLYQKILDIGGEIFRTWILKIDKNNLHRFKTTSSIHIDTGIAKYRLNLPLLNAESVETKFFKIINYNPEMRVINNYNVSTEFFQESDCSFRDSYIMSKPLVLNVKEPHGLFIVDNKWPRYILTIQFVDDKKLKSFLDS